MATFCQEICQKLVSVIRHSRVSQTCSIAFQLGEYVGYFIHSIPSVSVMFSTSPTVSDVTLSCLKIKLQPIVEAKVTTRDLSISSAYFYAITVPVQMICSSICPPMQIQSHQPIHFVYTVIFFCISSASFSPPEHSVSHSRLKRELSVNST